MFLAPLLVVVTTAVLETEVTIDETDVWDCGSDNWLLEPRFGLRGFSCLSDDWELEVNKRIATISIVVHIKLETLLSKYKNIYYFM